MKADFRQKHEKLMKHFYEGITGWFDFQSIYKNAVLRADDGAHFVEVGSFLGKSTAFMSVEIRNSGKVITFDAVDHFQGDEGTKGKFPDLHKGDLYSQFLLNMNSVLGNPLRPFPIPSLSAYRMYDRNSLDFVFIDGAHDYPSVSDDIVCWKTRVKEGGIIGGHDYREDCEGVWQAVNNHFDADQIKRIKNSWVVQL